MLLFGGRGALLHSPSPQCTHTPHKRVARVTVAQCVPGARDWPDRWADLLETNYVTLHEYTCCKGGLNVGPRCGDCCAEANKIVPVAMVATFLGCCCCIALVVRLHRQRRQHSARVSHQSSPQSSRFGSCRDEILSTRDNVIRKSGVVGVEASETQAGHKLEFKRAKQQRRLDEAFAKARQIRMRVSGALLVSGFVTFRGLSWLC